MSNEDYCDLLEEAFTQAVKVVPFYEFADIVFFPKKYKRAVSNYRAIHESLVDE